MTTIETCGMLRIYQAKIGLIRLHWSDWSGLDDLTMVEVLEAVNVSKNRKPTGKLDGLEQNFYLIL